MIFTGFQNADNSRKGQNNSGKDGRDEFEINAMYGKGFDNILYWYILSDARADLDIKYNITRRELFS